MKEISGERDYHSFFMVKNDLIEIPLKLKMQMSSGAQFHLFNCLGLSNVAELRLSICTGFETFFSFHSKYSLPKLKSLKKSNKKFSIRPSKMQIVCHFVLHFVREARNQLVSRRNQCMMQGLLAPRARSADFKFSTTYVVSRCIS